MKSHPFELREGNRIIGRINYELDDGITIHPTIIGENKPIGEIILPDKIDNSFILTYDDFGKELIRKNNERFSGTKAKIDLEDAQGNPLTGEVENFYWIKRGGSTTTIYNDNQLQKYGFFPITPLESEVLLKEGKLPKPEEYWEDLGLILFDRSSEGKNPREANALYESLKQNKDQLGLKKSDLEEKLLVVNAGIEKDSDMPHGVKPMVLLGLTEVYMPEVLKNIGKNSNFEYGLEHGLPAVRGLGKGERTLYMPSGSDIGLRVFCRGWDLDLSARYVDLVNSDSDGRVNFVRKGVAQI